MTASRDPERLIHSFLLEGEDTLQDQVYDAVRADIEQTRQRAVIGPWRMPVMNRIVGFGLAAVVIIAVVIGTQLLGSPNGNLGGDPAATATPEPTPEPTPDATPSPTAEAGLPQGRVAVTRPEDPVQVTFDIASPGWMELPEFNAVYKDDDGLDAPDTVGVALLAWAWPAGTSFDVYGDPCLWLSTTPETPATTPDAIAAAFTAQAETDATEAVDVTVGGYAGKSVTLTVPMSYEVPGATREEEFGDCDQDIFGFYAAEGDTEPSRNAQGPGQIDELWILDVEGSIVILDATYGPAAPDDLVEELRTLAESATFEVP